MYFKHGALEIDISWVSLRRGESHGAGDLCGRRRTRKCVPTGFALFIFKSRRSAGAAVRTGSLLPLAFIMAVSRP